MLQSSLLNLNDDIVAVTENSGNNLRRGNKKIKM